MNTLTRLNSTLCDQAPTPSFTFNTDKYAHNLSSHSLTNDQMEVLSCGLKFCLPRLNLSEVEINAEFEHLFDQLNSLIPKSNEDLNWMKAELVDIAYQYKAF